MAVCPTIYACGWLCLIIELWYPDKMDGYDFLRTLSNDSRLKHIPLIFLTAKISFEYKLFGINNKMELANVVFRYKELIKRD